MQTRARKSDRLFHDSLPKSPSRVLLPFPRYESAPPWPLPTVEALGGRKLEPLVVGWRRITSCALLSLPPRPHRFPRESFAALCPATPDEIKQAFDLLDAQATALRVSRLLPCTPSAVGCFASEPLLHRLAKPCIRQCHQACRRCCHRISQPDSQAFAAVRQCKT